MELRNDARSVSWLATTRKTEETTVLHLSECMKFISARMPTGQRERC